jgi:hypothetical protein
MKSFASCTDWPRPESRKTSEDGVKKFFCLAAGEFIPINREAVERWFFERCGRTLDLF